MLFICLSLDSKHRFALYRVGAIYYELENYESAMHYLEEAVRLSPNQLDAYSYLWNCYGKLGNYKKAVEIVNKALNVDPNYKKAKQMKTEMTNKLNEIYLIKGLECFKNKNYNDAISHFRDYLSIMPDCGKCYYYIGTCYFILEKYHDAISNYTKCVKLCPNDYKDIILKRIGICHFNLNDYKNTIQKLSLIDNQDVESMYYMGMSYLKLGDYKKAESLFRKIISCNSNIHLLKGDTGDYCYKIGKEYYLLKDYNKAIEYLNKSIELKPKNTGFWHFKGKVCYEMGDYNESKKCFEKVLSKNKNDTGALMYLEKIRSEKLHKTSSSKKYDKSKEHKTKNHNLTNYSTNAKNTKKSITKTQSNMSSHNRYKMKDNYKTTSYKRLNKLQDYEHIINKKCGNSIINTLKIHLSKIGLVNKNLANALALEKKVKEYYDKGILIP